MKRIITSLIFVIVTISTNAQWIEYNPLTRFNAINSVKFISPTIGWIVEEDGSIMRTNDGGTHWVIQRNGSDPYHSLLGVFFTDVNNGTAVGNGEIVRTKDGGTHWVIQRNGSEPYQSLRGGGCTEVNNGTAGGNGEIGRTTDGGTVLCQQ